MGKSQYIFFKFVFGLILVRVFRLFDIRSNVDKHM